MIDIADFAVGQARMLYGHTMPSERPAHRMYEQWHPLGIVGVITAFNFPVAVWAWNAFIAAIAGNITIWKPSHKTPLCAIAVQNICNDVLEKHGHPGVFSLFITNKTELAEAMVNDPRMSLISFTGSTKVGRNVGEQVAKRLGKSLLELGGNNAVLIDKSANLDIAIPSIVFGSAGTAGQRCTTTRRVFVHESLHNKLLERLLNAFKQIKIGDPTKPENLMGPLIDQAAVDSFVSAIATIKSEGGNILFGGKVIDTKGYFVEPTIVSVDKQLKIMQQETFAPILYVLKVQSIEEAIALQNDVAQGLSSSLFTTDLHVAEQFSILPPPQAP